MDTPVTEATPLQLKLHREHTARWIRWLPKRPAPTVTAPPPAPPRPHPPLTPKGPLLSVRYIMWTVARVFELTTDDLRGRARVGRIVHARHVSIWLCRDMLPKPIITTSYIGRCHAKDHATALNACSRMGDRLAGDPSLAEHVSEIRKRINDACGTAA